MDHDRTTERTTRSPVRSPQISAELEKLDRHRDSVVLRIFRMAKK